MVFLPGTLPSFSLSSACDMSAFLLQGPSGSHASSLLPSPLPSVLLGPEVFQLFNTKGPEYMCARLMGETFE